MGREREGWRVGVSLDAHGGQREKDDAKLWTEMRERLEEIATDPKYALLMPMTSDR